MPDKQNESGTESEWFEHAKHDLHSAKLLFREGGYTDTIAFHLQQATEKCLKGFLISKGWHLKKTHDLRELLDKAIEYNQDLNSYLTLARQLTALYIEDRYPAGPPVEYSKEEIAQLMKNTEELIARIKGDA